MTIKTSRYFGVETKFDCSNRFDEHRVQTLMGEVPQTKTIVGLCNSDTVFYDVGAAIGTMGLFIAHFAKKVVLIEPDPVHANLLKRNIELNGFSNVDLYTLGVGNTNGDAQLYTDNKTNGMCPSCRSGLGHRKSVNISMRTLDSLFEETGVPTILKMDIEGFEYEALEGMTQSPQTLFIEIHPMHAHNPNLPARITELLSPRYKQSYLYKRNTEWLSKWELQQ